MQHLRIDNLDLARLRLKRIENPKFVRYKTKSMSKMAGIVLNVDRNHFASTNYSTEISPKDDHA